MTCLGLQCVINVILNVVCHLKAILFVVCVNLLLLLLFTFNSRLEAHAVIYNGKNNIADKSFKVKRECYATF